MAGFRGLFVRKDATRGTTPVEARQALAGLLTASGDLGALPGVISGLRVIGLAGTWAYAVTEGHDVLSRGASYGAILSGLDGTTNTDEVPAAPGSGSRWDLIWRRHLDIDEEDATSDSVLGVTSGTASGSPSKPYIDVPAGALVIAEAQVGAGATGTLHANVTITQVAPRVGTRNGIIPVTTQAQLDALAAIATTSQPVYADYNGQLERNAGSGWSTIAVAGPVWTAIAPWTNWGSDVGRPIVAELGAQGVIRARGRVTRPGATFTGAPGKVAAVPAGLLPATARDFFVQTSNGQAAATLATNGDLSITTSMTWTQSVSWISLDGLTWELT